MATFIVGLPEILISDKDAKLAVLSIDTKRKVTLPVAPWEKGN